MTKDGGPAFPEPVAVTPAGDVYLAYGGMSLRDYFAGRALVGMLACPYSVTNGSSRVETAQAHATAAYEFADAMLAARDREDAS